MKTVVISDIHGQLFWKKIMNEVMPDDTVVCLGDYFDYRGKGPFAENQTDNFLEICALTRSRGNMHLLLGNHDWQYLPWDPYGCSNKDIQNAKKYRKALLDNFDLLNMVYRDGNILLSHGGVTNTFVKSLGIKEPEEMNEVLQTDPKKFNFIESGPNGEFPAMDGDDYWQGPLWARTNALAEDSLNGFSQMVGHTPVTEIAQFQGKGGPIFLTCTLDDRVLSFEKDSPSPK